MEPSEPKNLAEPMLKNSNSAKKWLWLLPVLGLCALAFCGVTGGVVFWQTRSQQTEEGSSGSDSSVQDQSGDSLGAAPIAQTPISQQAVEPASFTCPTNELTASPVITAPLLSPISFASHQAADGWPLDTSLQFTTTVTKVLATFAYAGLENGLAWERVWYFGDKELSRGSGLWDAGPAGRLSVQVVAGQGGFAPGTYKLEIYVQGQLLSQGAFYIVKADTPTQRPIQVAYTTWDGQTHQLHLLDLTTSQTETVATAAREPAWSFDAGGLLFYGEEGSETGAGLHVFNTGQKKIYPLNQETFFQTVAWSPQRAYVASAAAAEPETHLVLWDLEQNRAYPGPFGQDPAWSPEGQRLVYRSCDQTGWNISTIQVVGPIFETSSIRVLTQGDDSQPVWSWDGQRIAFVRREGANQDIYVMAADGSNLTRLTDDPAADVSPAWTPDHRLVFRSLRTGQWGIYVMSADGSDQHSLISTPAPADWQPDRLAVSTNILVVPPAPAKPQPQIPAGQGLLAISNQKNNDVMTFTIDGKENKIGPYQVWMLPLRPGHYTWTASWPGKNSRTGVADVALGQVVYPVVER
jgi:hypothetical protein